MIIKSDCPFCRHENHVELDGRKYVPCRSFTDWEDTRSYFMTCDKCGKDYSHIYTHVIKRESKLS